MKRVLHFSARALKAVFLTVFFLLMAIVIFLNSNFFDSYVRTLIQTKGSKAINRKITVDSVAFNPFRLDVKLRNFRMENDPRTPDVPFFTAEEIYARVSWTLLFSGRVQVSEVRLTNPTMSIIMYEKHLGGGTNWPKTGGKPKQQKSRVSVVISKVDIDNMIVLFDQRRIPVSFHVKDLESFVEFDPVKKNHFVTTTFKDGFLKITRFESWRFDMDAAYRIIEGTIHFEKLHFLSDHSKFFMAGTMANLKDPEFDMRFRSIINLEQTKEIFHFGPQMSGTGRFKATYKGTFGKFQMKGTGHFQNFRLFSLPIDTARFELDMTHNGLKVTGIRAEMFEGLYTGTFGIAPLKGNSIFKADAVFKNWDGRSLGRFIHMQDMVMPVLAGGKASIRWEESGGIKNMNGTFGFEIEPRTGPPYDLVTEAESGKFDNALYGKTFYLPFSSITGFRIEGKKLRELTSHLETPYTIADIEGTIDFSGEADLSIRSKTAKITEIDLLFHHLQSYFKSEPAKVQEFWKVLGSADFAGKLNATVWSPFEPRIQGKVLARNVYYHGVPLTTVEGDILLHDQLIEVFDSKMTLDQASGRARAKFYLADRKRGTPNALDLNGSIQEFPANAIAGAFGLDLPVRGKVGSTIKLKGPFDELEGRAEFEAVSGEMWGEKWDRATGTVLFLDDSLGLRDITAYIENGYAQASGDLVYATDDYNVQFTAENIPVDKLNVLKANGLEMTGTGKAQGGGNGSLLKPQLHATVSIDDLAYRGEFYGDVASMVKLSPAVLSLEATGTAHGAVSSVKAEAHLDGQIPFESTFDVQKFPLEILTRAYSEETQKVTGVIGGKFEVTGMLRPADVRHISGVLDLVQIDFAGLKLVQTAPIDVRLSDDVVQIRNCVLAGDHAKIALSGNVYPKQEGRLALELSADLGLEILSQWDKSISSSGQTSTRIGISGTLQQPALTGAMDIREGSFRHVSLPNSLTGINALVTFKNRNVTLQSFQALSSGGKLTAGGSAVLKGYAFEKYRFDVYADRVRVHYPEGLRTTVSGELHLQREKEISYLTGDLDVLQGIYLRSFEESPDVFRYARVPGFSGPGGAFDEVRLNIHIESGGNFLVRNNFADMECLANLNLIGTINDPVLTGRVEVIKGEITFRDREYRVLRGSLDFSNPYRTEAQLNFVAESRIREYLISLQFNGTFDRVYHEITSDPPLPRDDLYSLIGAGSTRREAEGVGISNLLLGEEISRFVTAPIASPLEKGFRKAFGLQRFHIDPTYVQSTQTATARITLEKDISSDFSVTYSTNLFTVAEEIILLQYQLTDEIRITASKDEQARYGVDVVVTKTFE